MKIFRKKQKSWYYDEQEAKIVEDYINDTFGNSEEVFHEVVSPDIHVDLFIIEPSEERNFYTLVTMGMGARKMDVPKEFRKCNGGRAEIMVTLPADWDVKSGDEENYWPLRWLKILARLPITNDTWLGWGHTVPNGGPFADNTELSGVLLTEPYLSECIFKCDLPSGGHVEFYHMIPLYEEEMNFKIEHSAEDLLARLGDDFSHVVKIDRPNCCK